MMADQARWFKLWNTAPSDGKIQALCPAHRWAWAAFGCYTKVHGEHGVVIVLRSNCVLAAEMGVTVDLLFDVILTFPNMQFDLSDVDNGKLIVTWLNWKKYQEDSTVYERVKKWRERQSVTVQEEKRREDNRNTPKPPKVSAALPPGFVEFWAEYPKKVGKIQAIQEWIRLDPDVPLQAVMLEAVRMQKRTVKAMVEKDKHHILDPERWIKYRRWEDELQAENEDLFAKLERVGNA